MRQNRMSGWIFVISASLAMLAGHSASAIQPVSYAGQERREIKALPPEEINDYLAGKGMGLAKAAELNGYPGPAHVLELAGPLRLSTDQKQRTEKIFMAMQAEARKQGALLVKMEGELDRRFSAGSITPEDLRSSLAMISRVLAEIRRAHLQAHLEQKAILTPEQVHKYNALRGYDSQAERVHAH